MNSFKLGAFVVASFACVLVAGQPAAGGTGLFIEYGRNIATSGGDVGNPPAAALDLLDRNELSIGLTTDSNLADPDKLTNFRFDIGYHRVAYASGFSDALFGASNGAMMNGALGFGILRAEAFRLWVGPALRMNFDYYDRVQTFDYQIGVGPQVGFNFNFGDNLSAVLTGAYNYKWGWFVDTSSAGFGTSSHRDHYLMINLALYLRRN